MLLSDLKTNGFCEGPAQVISGPYEHLRWYRLMKLSNLWWSFVMLSIATLMFLVSVEPPLKPEHDKLFGAAPVSEDYDDPRLRL